MSNTRRVELIVHYLGQNISQDLKPYLSQFSYTDNEGKSDDIQITLQDRDKKWQDPWLPRKGDTITAKIRTHNWSKEGEVSQLDCGTFHVDDIGFKGPPDAITIKALSIPFNKGGKSSKKTRAWENVGLATIASDIATTTGLSLIFDAPNHFYDRVDQSRETDLAFIKRLAKKEGISVKVTKEQLVLYDEFTYESKSSIRTFTRGEQAIASYDFKETAAEEQYQKVEVRYFDDTKKKELKYTYDVPGIEKGPTYKVNKRVKNLGEAMRWAKAEARRKNKGAKTGKLSLMGDVELVQGLTIQIKGFGAFDGKYFIKSSAHRVGNKYTTDIDLREVLGY